MEAFPPLQPASLPRWLPLLPPHPVQSPPQAWAMPLCPGAAAPPSSPVCSLTDSYQPSWSLQPAMDVSHGGVFLVASITPAPVVADGSSTWPPVNPCELHCWPSNEYFAEKLWDAMVNGTPCYQGRVSQDLCINGICKVCLVRKRLS
ncbi:hypothetical protein P7K49_040722 [Saguinus oedipus]|uniref:Uncharacterized protein n=1 Tax=Saguinus oedipus TaxID=9490 RepID=A0ABQ9TAP5_SAGOE|nr:hypothetical protein P7K49_040722 [Saguinus oedipus]